MKCTICDNPCNGKIILYRDYSTDIFSSKPSFEVCLECFNLWVSGKKEELQNKIIVKMEKIAHD